MTPFSLIVALDNKKGIGKDGTLPWHLPADLKHFKDITTHTEDSSKQNIVIMGRKTWDSLPEKFRPLPNRINLVLTRNDEIEFPSGVLKAKGFQEVLNLLESDDLKGRFESVYVIGGAQIFAESLKQENCKKIYFTFIEDDFQCDTFFPPYDELFQQDIMSSDLSENDLTFQFAVYLRK